jgi:hypothetical protein
LAHEWNFNIRDRIALVHIDHLLPGAGLLRCMIETFEQHRDEGRRTEKKPLLDYIYTAGLRIELDNSFAARTLQRVTRPTSKTFAESRPTL